MAQDNKNAVSSMLPPTEETTATSKPPPPLPTIPFDLVVEILCRLPVKSLLQLRCVCKSWKSLISDPEFAKTHLRCSPKDFTCHHTMANLRSYRSRALMVYPLQSVFNAAAVTTPATATRVKYPLNDQNRFNFIAGSCHGMLLLDIDESSPILWNPSTRRFKKLPSLENPLLEEEDCECYTTYGFGYDHSTDRYKVVAVFCLKCDDDDDDEVYYETQVKVHTLGTDSWRSIEDFGSGDPGNESGKFVSGTLNWLLSDDLVIVSFDLGNESYQEHCLPDCLPVCGGVVWGLGVFRDCLCFIADHDDHAFGDIWLMKEYGNKDSWTKLFRMKMMELDLLIPYLLHISEDGEVLLLDHRGKLVLYNSREATFKTARIQDSNRPMDSAVYVESLISPCSL